jgi:DNA-binding Lrp family transcriptional regulator
MAKRQPQRRRGKRERPSTRFTAKQGQYLAYLYLYRKLHRHGPAESEIAKFFGVSGPSVHQMIVKLEEKGLITREPGAARSVRVAVPRGEIPQLDDNEEDVVVVARPVNRHASGPVRLYTLQVALLADPMSEKFADKTISRTIQIRGDQTLENLHRVIFDAFGRFDEHFYEFQFGNGPHDPKGKRYVLPEMLEQGCGDRTIAGDVTQTTIESLHLKVDQPFGYWFDYGDDWWHQVDVQAIDENVPRGKYPKVIKRVGKNPPQYMDEED